MKFSPSSCNFLSLKSKYLSQHFPYSCFRGPSRLWRRVVLWLHTNKILIWFRYAKRNYAAPARLISVTALCWCPTATLHGVTPKRPQTCVLIRGPYRSVKTAQSTVIARAWLKDWQANTKHQTRLVEQSHCPLYADEQWKQVKLVGMYYSPLVQLL